MSENNTIYENGALPVKSQFLFYQTEDGRTRIEVRLENETVWLTQKLMAELFQKDVRTINEHIQNIHEEGELSPDSTIRKFRIVQPEGTWTGARPKKADSEIAKNYLTVEELDTLNRLVTIYLDFAELQALNRKPMYMRDWIDKLDEFLKVSERDILTHAGRVSHEAAIEKARTEYEKFRRPMLEEPSPVERHFIETVKELKKLEKSKPQTTRKARKGEKE